MVCPACGLPNDPSATTCVRCRAPMTAFTPPPRPAPAPVFAGPPQPAPGRRPVIAVVAVAVIVLALAGIGVVLFRRGGDPAPAAAPAPVTPAASPAPAGATAAQQVAVIDKILSDSVRSRRKLNAAIEKVRGCSGLGGAVDAMEQVGDEREAQLAAVEAAGLGRVTGGEKLRKLLSTALQRALDADQGYLGWARPAESGGCKDTAARRAAYTEGDKNSTAAGVAKVAFLRAWNPVATANGLRARSRDDI